MCDCPEIQDKKPTGPSWITNLYYGRHMADGTERMYLFGCSHPEDMVEQSIWLPRQDQLQGMLPDTFSNRTPVALIDKLDKFIDVECKRDNRHSIEVINWSMEQLWLAFVMKEKFNKTWNGDKWV